MEDDKTGDNDKELTSTSSPMGKLLSTNPEEKNDSNDTLPTSSTDANTCSKSSQSVSDDPISSTSNEMDSTKPKSSTDALIDVADKASTIDPDAELLAISITAQSHEKIEENVYDLVNDLETLLGESTDAFTIPTRSTVALQEKTEEPNIESSLPSEKTEDEVSSNTEIVVIKPAPLDVANESGSEEPKAEHDLEQSVSTFAEIAPETSMEVENGTAESKSLDIPITTVEEEPSTVKVVEEEASIASVANEEQQLEAEVSTDVAKEAEEALPNEKVPDAADEEQKPETDVTEDLLPKEKVPNESDQAAVDDEREKEAASDQLAINRAKEVEEAVLSSESGQAPVNEEDIQPTACVELTTTPEEHNSSDLQSQEESQQNVEIVETKDESMPADFCESVPEGVSLEPSITPTQPEKDIEIEPPAIQEETDKISSDPHKCLEEAENIGSNLGASGDKVSDTEDAEEPVNIEQPAVQEETDKKASEAPRCAEEPENIESPLEAAGDKVSDAPEAEEPYNIASEDSKTEPIETPSVKITPEHAERTLDETSETAVEVKDNSETFPEDSVPELPVESKASELPMEQVEESSQTMAEVEITELVESAAVPEDAEIIEVDPVVQEPDETSDEAGEILAEPEEVIEDAEVEPLEATNQLSVEEEIPANMDRHSSKVQFEETEPEQQIAQEVSEPTVIKSKEVELIIEEIPVESIEPTEEVGLTVQEILAESEVLEPTQEVEDPTVDAIKSTGEPNPIIDEVKVIEEAATDSVESESSLQGPLVNDLETKVEQDIVDVSKATIEEIPVDDIKSSDLVLNIEHSPDEDIAEDIEKSEIDEAVIPTQVVNLTDDSSENIESIDKAALTKLEILCELKKPLSELNVRRKTVEQDLEKVVCLSEESSDSDDVAADAVPVSSIIQPIEEDQPFELDQLLESQIEPCEPQDIPEIEEILTEQPGIDTLMEPVVESTSSFETMLAVASLENEVACSVKEERRLSEKEIQEMEAIRMAVASITDSSQDTYDSFLVDNTVPLDSDIQQDVDIPPIEGLVSEDAMQAVSEDSTEKSVLEAGEPELIQPGTVQVSGGAEAEEPLVKETQVEEVTSVGNEDLTDAVSADETKEMLLDDEALVGNMQSEASKEIPEVTENLPAQFEEIAAGDLDKPCKSPEAVEPQNSPLQSEECVVVAVESTCKSPEVIETPSVEPENLPIQSEEGEIGRPCNNSEAVEAPPIETETLPLQSENSATVEDETTCKGPEVVETPFTEAENVSLQSADEIRTPCKDHEAVEIPLIETKNLPVQSDGSAAVEIESPKAVGTTPIEAELSLTLSKPTTESKEEQGDDLLENDVSALPLPAPEETVIPENIGKSGSKEVKPVGSMDSSPDTTNTIKTVTQEIEDTISEANPENLEAVKENCIRVTKTETVLPGTNKQATDERPLRSRTRRSNRVNEPLSINVEEVERKEVCSPKITIKPLKAPEDEITTSSTSEMENNKGSLKMTITKQADKMHSILKVYNPDEEAQSPQSQEEPIPKLIIKPKIQQVEHQQHSPKMATRSSKGYSPTSPRCGSPRVTIKPVTKPAEAKSETLSPLKISFKPVVKPEESARKHSPKPPKDSEKNHNPKITIKPIPKPAETEKEDSVATPKVTIKPVKRPAEDSENDLDHERSSPKITIKPVVKPLDHESDQTAPSTPKLKIKPIKKHEEEECVPQETELLSPKINIKPVVKPSEQEEEESDDVKERIVLKINRGNLPATGKESKKREYPEDDKAEKVGIKLKFSTTGGHTHIIQGGEESNKRQRKDSGYSSSAATKKEPEENPLKRPLEEKPPERNKRLRNSTSPDKAFVNNDLSAKLEPVADSLKSLQALPEAHDISKIADLAAQTTHIGASPVLTVGVATPTALPKRRGRPRKIPLQVREELSTPEIVSPSPSVTSSDADTPTATPPTGGRPKRSCRGQNVIATLGIKPRKPRGRGRGSKVNMGDRTPPTVEQIPVEQASIEQLPVKQTPVLEPEETVSVKPKKDPVNPENGEPSKKEEDTELKKKEESEVVKPHIEAPHETPGKKKKEDKTLVRKLEVTTRRQKAQLQKVEVEKTSEEVPKESDAKKLPESIIKPSEIPVATTSNVTPIKSEENVKKKTEEIGVSAEKKAKLEEKQSILFKHKDLLERKSLDENEIEIITIEDDSKNADDNNEDEEEDESSEVDSELEKRRAYVLKKKQEALKKCRAKRMEKLARVAEMKKKRLQQREAKKAAEEAERIAAEKARATKRYGRYGVPKPQISLVDQPPLESSGTVKSLPGLDKTQPVTEDENSDKDRLEPSTLVKCSESMVVDPLEETPVKLRGSIGSEDVVMVDEETRMSADLRGSRAQTPAKQAVSDMIVVEDSQGSVGTEGGKSRSCKTPKMEVFQDLEAVFTADQLAEYSWNGQGPFMLQEQVTQYLGIKSFKRKYPNVTRRPVDMQERDYLKENSLVTEGQCDLGLTAVLAQDILDIMYTDFQEKYEEYCRAQREKQARELADKQRALNQVSLKPGFDKLDILEQAVQSVASWNQQFNKARREQRKAYMDLQNLTIHYPKSKMKVIPTPKIGHYPVALVPGQFIDYYKEYTPTELNNLPLNTMCYDEIKIPSFHTDSDDSSSGSESESDSDSSSSGSSCDDEHCKDCLKKGRKTNGVRETDSDDVVIIENDASSSDSVVLVSVTEAITA